MASRWNLVEVAEREGRADQQDGHEDEPANRGAAWSAWRARLHVGDPLSATRPVARQHQPVDDEGDRDRDDHRDQRRDQIAVLLPEALVDRCLLRPSAGRFLRENARMTPPMPTCAVLLDALGTLVELDPPWRHLAEALGTEPDDRLIGAVRAEMGYYREHSHEGATPPRWPSSAPAAPGALRELGREVVGGDDDVDDPLPGLRRRVAGAGRAAGARTRRSLRLQLGRSLPQVLAAAGSRAPSTPSSPRPRPARADPAIFEPALRRPLRGGRGDLRRGHARRGHRGRPAAGIPALLVDRRRGRYRLLGVHQAPSPPATVTPSRSPGSRRRGESFGRAARSPGCNPGGRVPSRRRLEWSPAPSTGRGYGGRVGWRSGSSRRC